MQIQNVFAGALGKIFGVENGNSTANNTTNSSSSSEYEYYDTSDESFTTFIDEGFETDDDEWNSPISMHRVVRREITEFDRQYLALQDYEDEVSENDEFLIDYELGHLSDDNEFIPVDDNFEIPATIREDEFAFPVKRNAEMTNGERDQLLLQKEKQDLIKQEQARMAIDLLQRNNISLLDVQRALRNTTKIIHAEDIVSYVLRELYNRNEMQTPFVGGDSHSAKNEANFQSSTNSTVQDNQDETSKTQSKFFSDSNDVINASNPPVYENFTEYFTPTNLRNGTTFSSKILPKIGLSVAASGGDDVSNVTIHFKEKVSIPTISVPLNSSNHNESIFSPSVSTAPSVFQDPQISTSFDGSSEQATDFNPSHDKIISFNQMGTSKDNSSSTENSEFLSTMSIFERSNSKSNERNFKSNLLHEKIILSNQMGASKDNSPSAENSQFHSTMPIFATSNSKSNERNSTSNPSSNVFNFSSNVSSIVPTVQFYKSKIFTQTLPTPSGQKGSHLALPESEPLQNPPRDSKSTFKFEEEEKKKVANFLITLIKKKYQVLAHKEQLLETVNSSSLLKNRPWSILLLPTLMLLTCV